MSRPTNKELELMKKQHEKLRQFLINAVNEYAQPVGVEQLLKDNKKGLGKFTTNRFLLLKTVKELAAEKLIQVGRDPEQKGMIVYWSNELKDIKLPAPLVRTSTKNKRRPSNRHLGTVRDPKFMRQIAELGGYGKGRKEMHIRNGVDMRDLQKKLAGFGIKARIDKTGVLIEDKHGINMHGADVKIDIDKTTGRVLIAARGVTIDLGVV